MTNVSGAVHDSSRLTGKIFSGTLHGDIGTEGNLKGEIKTANLQVSALATKDISASIASKAVSGEIHLNVRVIEGGDLPAYEGPYAAVPKIFPQILATENKKMLYDLEIESIPYQDVANEYGRTITIGGIIDG